MSIWRWAAASHERALDNARAAAVECSRRRLERAEVAEVLAELTTAHAGNEPRPAAPAVGHEMSVRAGAR